MEVWLRAETQPGLSICVMLTIYILPPPHLSADMRESCVYGVLRKNSSVHSVAVAQFCDVLFLIIIISTNNDIPLFHHPLRKSKLTIFLGCHYACFKVGPLASWSCFPALSWATLASINMVQPPAWPSREPSDLSGLEPDDPTWA